MLALRQLSERGEGVATVVPELTWSNGIGIALIAVLNQVGIVIQ